MTIGSHQLLIILDYCNNQDMYGVITTNNS